jgi:transposase
MDNLPFHRGGRVRELVEERGCEVLYLSPYLLYLNPIEGAFAKVKALLQGAAAMGHESLSRRWAWLSTR